MNFLVLRGQGIKLTSFIDKSVGKRHYARYSKDESQDGYEGTVLDPKTGLYTDDPVV